MRWVSPFGNLRIIAHLQLPEAYRSLSRPSSAPDAKAFPLRSFSLDLVVVSISAHNSQYSIRKVLLVLLSVELCRLIKEVSLAKIVIITLLIKKVFLYCCLLIIAS